MIIGLDFDNTIVCYDCVFHRAACEQSMIPEETPVTKTGVRDYLRSIGREDDWTRLQGYVYGRRMNLATIYPGAVEFIRHCLDARVTVKVISHKTNYPYLGPRYDLHAAARDFLKSQGLLDDGVVGLSPDNVFFETELAAKLERIAEQGCTHYLDDLPEVLAHSDFPKNVRRFLFDPSGAHANAAGHVRVTSWPEFQRRVFESMQ
jgi:hypothetical protein